MTSSKRRREFTGVGSLRKGGRNRGGSREKKAEKGYSVRSKKRMEATKNG